ncbi:hypothetical protein FACS18948_7330 [Clostridia bacterium]|nr:hypothetical protein FACS18948_7330 [Clostridia bacterium]
MNSTLMLAMTVPATREMLLIIRMALSGLCTRMGIGLTDIECARIASDEACWCLLNRRGLDWADRLSLECTVEDGRICAKYMLDGAVGARENHGARGADKQGIGAELTKSILETLVDEVRIASDDFGARTIELTWNNKVS